MEIDEEKQTYANRLLQSLVISIRPLRVKELAELFAMLPDAESTTGPDFGWRPEDPEAFILSACSTLVAIVNVAGTKVVQFSHFSVREYLTSIRIAKSENVSHFHIVPKSAHSLLATACLSVLLQLDERIDMLKIKDFPLAPYAAEHWMDHAHFGDVSSAIQSGLDGLFDRNKPHFAAWIWLHDIDNNRIRHHFSPHRTGHEGVPLYYAALCGFRDLAERLVDSYPQDVNARGGYHGTPLHAAAYKGHSNIALLLLERGADVDFRNKVGRRPLHLASRPDLAQFLLDHSANVNALDAWGATALHFASFHGHIAVGMLLLEHGANVSAQTNDGWTPLHNAARGGHLEVVQLLLDHGADANAKKEDHWAALHLAALDGNRQVVEVLLNRGADPHARTYNDATPFRCASTQKHTQIMQLLSELTGETM